jgi:hypothetical protein
VEAFEGGLLVGEVPAGLGPAPVAGVQALDGVGGADDLPDGVRQAEEGHELAPGPLPGSRDRGVALAPGGVEADETRPGLFLVDGGVDGLETTGGLGVLSTIL